VSARQSVMKRNGSCRLWATDEVKETNNTHNQKLTANARTLRRNMTKEERHLWYDFLKGLQITVKRQTVIGNYIVDFYCPSVKLVIEIDGSQHYVEKVMAADSERDEYMRSIGLVIKRYSNTDINNKFDSVCEDIYNFICSIKASP
jgi:very-short-patch-repair endonuclease